MAPRRSTMTRTHQFRDDLQALRRILTRRWRHRVPFLDGVDPYFRPGSGVPWEARVPDLAPQRPAWMGEHEPLLRTVEGWNASLRYGRTTWAAIVSANAQLWEHGDQDLPAVVVWSPDPWFDEAPLQLQRIAHRVFSVRDRDRVAPELLPLRESLRNPFARELGLLVPPLLTGGRLVYLSSLLVVRSHLPQRSLLRGVVPVRAGEEWDFPVLLPSALWGEPLLRWWQAELEPFVFRRRVDLVGPPPGPEARLPEELRWFLAGNRTMLASLAGIAAVPLGGALWLAWAALDQGFGDWSRPEQQLFLAVIASLVVAGGWLARRFRRVVHTLRERHQGVMDLFEAVWRRGGVVWSGYHLVPKTTRLGTRHFDLVLDVLGQWLVLRPDLWCNTVQVSVTWPEGADAAPSGRPRVLVTYALDSLVADPAAALPELRAVFRQAEVPDPSLQPRPESGASEG